MAAAAISRARSADPSFSATRSLLAALFSHSTISCSSTTSQLCSPFAQIRFASTHSDVTVSKDTSRRLHRYSYIVAPDQIQAGMKVMNFDAGAATSSAGWKLGMLDPLSQVGNCMPLGDMRIGTFVHCVEFRPGEGAKFVRAAGTSAKIMRLGDGQCVLKMPSGFEKVFDARCKATIGRVSNPERKHMKLRKAGQARWLGRRPVVRGVAMNPVDHPHGGGEGRTSGGRPSVTPWGKPTKGGYKTVPKKNHIVRNSGSTSSSSGKRKSKRS